MRGTPFAATVVLFCLVLLTGTGLAQPQPKKQIKDRTEYNAYVSAVQEADPVVKAQALEGFLNQYPGSVVREDALEALIGAYQKAHNEMKVQEAAQRLLSVNRCNVRALALMAYLMRTKAEAGHDPAANAQAAAVYGNRGMECLATTPQPAGMSDSDFQKLKTQLAGILQSAQTAPAMLAPPSVGDQVSLEVVRSWRRGSDVYINTLVAGQRWTLHCDACPMLDTGRYTGDFGKKDVTVYVHKIGDDPSKSRKQKYSIYSEHDWLEPLR